MTTPAFFAGLTQKEFNEPYTSDAWGTPFVYRLHETQKAYVPIIE